MRKLETWLPWLVLFGLNLALILAGTAPYFRLLSTPCLPGNCVFFQLSLGSAQALSQVGFRGLHLTTSFYAWVLTGLTLGSILIIDSIAVILFLKNSRTRMALFMSYFLLTLGPTFFFTLTEALAKEQPAWRIPVNILSALGIWFWITFAILFPDGRLVYRWLIWYIYLSAVSTLAMFTFASLPAIAVPKTPLAWMLFFLLLLLLGGSAIFQVYRYGRISGSVEKQQTKWVVFGFALFALEAILYGFIGVSIPSMSQPGLPNALYYLLGGTLNVTCLLVMLGCVVIAILRFHLWDIDVLIRRTLVYSVLTGLLGFVYFSGVAVLQGVLTADRGLPTAVSSPPSAVVIVITTLAIAALFNPLRKRLQDFIDRRFYRQKYNAEKALSDFAAAARSQADLPSLTTSLVSVVQDTVQPEEVKLWLKPTRP